jgi:hypothetical protein
VVVYHGLEERRTPGNTMAVQPDKPYQGLSMFGTGQQAEGRAVVLEQLLKRFQGLGRGHITVRRTWDICGAGGAAMKLHGVHGCEAVEGLLPCIV